MNLGAAWIDVVFFVVEMCQVLFLDIDGVLHPAVPHGEVFRPERHGGKWQWLA